MTISGTSSPLATLPDGSPVSDTGAGILPVSGSSSEFILGAQFQLLL